MKIFLVGFMGCGKTTVGKYLAKKLNYIFIDLDLEITKTSGLSIQEFFSKFGEPEFRKIEHDVLLKYIRLDQNTVFATGGGMPCFNNNMDIMNQFGETVYLKRDLLTLELILQNSKKPRPLLINKENLFGEIEVMLDKRKVFYEQAKHIVKINGLLPKEKIVKMILNELNNF